MLRIYLLALVLSFNLYLEDIFKFMLDFSKIKQVHVVGIGGIGVSALARIFLAQGKRVSGSDREDSALLRELTQEGAEVFVGHDEASVCCRSKAGLAPKFLVVRSLAVPDDNPELKKARKLKIPILTYPEALGILTRDYDTIAICGTHGKTTTTALTSLVLEKAGLDPTVVIGTKVKEFGNRNVRIGKSKYLVVEACEYRRAFLNLQPKVVVITNIEAEHLDYYKDLEDYRSAFTEFAGKVPKNGFIIANFDDENVKKAVWNSKSQARIISFGNTDGFDFSLSGSDIFEKNKKIGQLDLKVPGTHNLKNALAALVVGRSLRVDVQKIVSTLNEFQGSWRRFEFKGHYKGAEIYDDYAHHPTEIRATLQAAREKFPERRIVCVFQPHQYSRTKKLLGDFGQAFADADLVIIPNIYRVRDSEDDVDSVSAEKLVREIRKHHRNVAFGGGFEKTVKYLKENLKTGEVVLVMGAGDVWRISEQLSH